MDGFINVYKPAGMTSHDVVAIIRRRLPRKTKVGHTGTLDPDAVGVLPVCVGKGTRLAEFFTPLQKVYLGEMTLGAVTSTQDVSGEVLKKAEAEQLAAITEAAVEQAAAEFVGEIEQIPPMVSAVKIGGKKLYELAREGKVVERQPRKVTIYNLEIVDMQLPKVVLRVICSGGTYIRTFMNDIGEKLGVGAYMSRLERQAVGDFTAENALPLEQVQAMLEADDFSCLLPMEYGLTHLPVVKLQSERQYDNVLHGRAIQIDSKAVGMAAGKCKVMYGDKLIAIGERATGSDCLKMNKVLISEH